ncbi:probable transcription factor At1g61730 [Cicer arietinum]
MVKEMKSFEQGSSSTRKLFERVFSENDEVVILQGVAARKVVNIYSDDAEIYNYFKEKLSFKPSQAQLKEKIRKLRMKFIGKVKNKLPIFPRQHDLRLYNLSKKVWIPKTKELDENGLKNMFESGRKLLNKKTKAEFDERWNKLKLMEIDYLNYRSAFCEDLSKTLSSV